MAVVSRVRARCVSFCGNLTYQQQVGARKQTTIKLTASQTCRCTSRSTAAFGGPAVLAFAPPSSLAANMIADLSYHQPLTETLWETPWSPKALWSCSTMPICPGPICIRISKQQRKAWSAAPGIASMPLRPAADHSRQLRYACPALFYPSSAAHVPPHCLL